MTSTTDRAPLTPWESALCFVLLAHGASAAVGLGYALLFKPGVTTPVVAMSAFVLALALASGILMPRFPMRGLIGGALFYGLQSVAIRTPTAHWGMKLGPYASFP